MRYYHLWNDHQQQLIVERGKSLFNLAEATPSVQRFEDILKGAAVTNQPIDTIAEMLIEDAAPLSREVLEERPLSMPLSPDEVWAAGVTYRISEEARKTESSMPEIYLDAYQSDRPELFFKATADRTVGPNEAVGIRRDSEWDVPEPELGVVMSYGKVIGYTIGNDVSSRSIEGQNPLYLPQAKVYDRCCALGPCIRSAASLEDPHTLEMWMSIRRDDEIVYEESTNTSEMVRTVEELVSYYSDHNSLPRTSVLLTGTSLVPEDEFTLRAADNIEIGIEGIGTLSNSVVEV
ncbi:fumarylacetoacetate hydrolase family protein [Halobellus limi]|uniref:2-dehydro-3-deoxy-D-xylonate dehydratase n=1 Tax=Halobellus limi TaxID=699433 RepID=A0A1H6BMW3_9EURY|nr:fumarylacetoacetate hydrolase family protein [Halobellus limi]QCC49421.1 fumarylacetoacetate hydrolase [Halobellus limi]SEG62059.1 2-dehydro-3-deoxy-D-xylonate dehydratase [Halobellus limi]